MKSIQILKIIRKDYLFSYYSVGKETVPADFKQKSGAQSYVFYIEVYV